MALTTADLQRGKDSLDAIDRTANSKTLTTTNADGQTVQTIYGALTNFGYDAPNDFTADSPFLVDRPQQTTEYNGLFYAPKPSSLPFTTTGVFDENQWYLATVQNNIPRKNLLIGNFRVNQRGVAGSVVLAAGEYGHDRFKAGAGGCSYTFSTLNGVTTVDISAGSLIQTVKGSSIIQGYHSLSWSGTAQASLDGGAFGDSGEVVEILAGGVNVDVEFGIGTVSKPQLEYGRNSTTYQSRTIEEELSLCRAYFWKPTLSVIIPLFRTGTVVNHALTIALPVRMNRVPDVTGTVSLGNFTLGYASIDFLEIQSDSTSETALIRLTALELDAEIA